MSKKPSAQSRSPIEPEQKANYIITFFQFLFLLYGQDAFYNK